VPTGPVKAVLTDQILIRKGKIWTARRRIAHVAIFQASASKAFKAEVIGLVVVAVIASAVAADLAAAGLADSVAEEEDLVGAGDDNQCLELICEFSAELDRQTTTQNKII
jgi:hypothetical protein